MTTWPERGRCGACARPAQRFPSLRWEHHGRPCALRHRTLMSPAEVPLPPAVFVPEGQELPDPGRRGRWQAVDDEPSALGWIAPSTIRSYWDQVRARLAADAEQQPAAVDR